MIPLWWMNHGPALAPAVLGTTLAGPALGSSTMTWHSPSALRITAPTDVGAGLVLPRAGVRAGAADGAGAAPAVNLAPADLRIAVACIIRMGAVLLGHVWRHACGHCLQ